MKEKGFTLLELMVSITILSVILLGIASLFPRGLGYSTQTRMMSKASSLAQGKAEEMERLATTHADLTAGTHTETVDGFTRTWVITDNTPMKKIKKAEIEVSWETAGAMDRVGVEVYLYKP